MGHCDYAHSLSLRVLIAALTRKSVKYMKDKFKFSLGDKVIFYGSEAEILGKKLLFGEKEPLYYLSFGAFSVVDPAWIKESKIQKHK